MVKNTQIYMGLTCSCPAESTLNLLLENKDGVSCVGGRHGYKVSTETHTRWWSEFKKEEECKEEVCFFAGCLYMN